MADDIEVKPEETETPELKDNEEPTKPKDEEVKDDVEKEEEVVDPDKIEVETRKKDEDKVDYGEEIDPDDIKTIGSIVEKQTLGLKKQLQETQDRVEVEAFIQEKPEFAKYRPIIMKYLQHPVYSKIPVKNIASMVAANDLMKLGAKKEREAQIKADATRSGGTAVRKDQGGQTDWSRVPKDAFEAQKRKILGQQV